MEDSDYMWFAQLVYTALICPPTKFWPWPASKTMPSYSSHFEYLLGVLEKTTKRDWDDWPAMVNRLEGFDCKAPTQITLNPLQRPTVRFMSLALHAAIPVLDNDSKLVVVEQAFPSETVSPRVFDPQHEQLCRDFKKLYDGYNDQHWETKSELIDSILFIGGRAPDARKATSNEIPHLINQARTTLDAMLAMDGKDHEDRNSLVIGDWGCDMLAPDAEPTRWLYQQAMLAMVVDVVLAHRQRYECIVFACTTHMHLQELARLVESKNDSKIAHVQRLNQGGIHQKDPPFDFFTESINTRWLMTTHPPQFINQKKKKLYTYCTQDKPLPEGDITFYRFQPLAIPSDWKAVESKVEIVGGVFDYKPSTRSSSEWYMNFADRKLFGFYCGALFAQDEIQVQEHPQLGSMHAYLTRDNSGYETNLVRTRDTKANPTPCLFTNVPRWCSIDTKDIYGRDFQRTDYETIKEQTTKLDLTYSNIIAMEAPKHGRGNYTKDQMVDIFTTAYTGFRAVAYVVRTTNPKQRAVVHTGHWGCGAYGGNQQLMAILQIVAANLAGVDLVYHAFDQAGTAQAQLGKNTLDEVIGRMKNNQTHATETRIDEMVNKGFKWGVSDKN
jgi:hypothetical protein